MPTWLCSVASKRCYIETQDECSHIYPPTYLSIYLPNYLHTVREDLIPIHLSIYYFLLSLFLEKWGGKDTYELDKAYSFKRNGASAAAMLCYLHGRTFYFTPALFCCLYISWGSYEYLPLQSTRFCAPGLKGAPKFPLTKTFLFRHVLGVAGLLFSSE